ncbi:hypothetical protein FOA52_004216 [Chlamydomonas sp. UWO 241]|nr:hypothetical protein FOA52_004216 [Chlamydomonas sp. UWO 241]
MTSTFDSREWTLPPHLCCVQQVSGYGDLSPYFAASGGLGSLRASVASSDLWQEAALLRRLLYKNVSQHRSSHHLQRLRKVARCLDTLEALRLPHLMSDIDAMVQLASSLVPRGSDAAAVKGSGGGGRATHRLPLRSAAAHVMARLMLGCCVLQGLPGVVVTAADFLTQQVAATYFMPLSMGALALLARTQALATQLLLDIARAYNDLAQMMPLLPPPCRGVNGKAARAEWAAARLQRDVLGSLGVALPEEAPPSSAPLEALLPQLLSVSWQPAPHALFGGASMGVGTSRRCGGAAASARGGARRAARGGDIREPLKTPAPTAASGAGGALLPCVTVGNGCWATNGGQSWAERGTAAWDAHGLTAAVDVVRLARPRAPVGGASAGGAAAAAAAAAAPRRAATATAAAAAAAAAAAEAGTHPAPNTNRVASSGRRVLDMPHDAGVPVPRVATAAAPPPAAAAGAAGAAGAAAPPPTRSFFNMMGAAGANASAAAAAAAAAAAPKATRSFFDMMGAAGAKGVGGGGRVSAAQPAQRLSVFEDRGQGRGGGGAVGGGAGASGPGVLAGGRGKKRGAGSQADEPPGDGSRLVATAPDK